MEIRQVIQLLTSRMLTIILYVLMGTGAFGAYTVYMIKPVYEASADLILTNEGTNGGTDYNALMAGDMLIETYRDILLTSGFVEKVARAAPELNMTADELLIGVSTTTAGSQIMSIVVRNASYEKARQIANGLAAALVREIPNVMKLNNLSLLNPAPENPHPSPVKPSLVMNVSIGFLFSLLLSVSVILFREHIRENFRSAVEFERAVGMPVLAVMPRVRKSEACQVIRSISNDKEEERFDVVVEP